MKFIKDNFVSLIVLVLVLVLFLERCKQPVPEQQGPKIIRDTQWVKKDSLVFSKPQIINRVTAHDTVINNYIPDTNYGKLVIQYQNLVNQLLTKNIHLDSIRIDSNGYVKILDTVQKNEIVGRSTEVKMKYPVIKETIILPPKLTNQLYIGGGIYGSQGVSGIKGGLLYKNKKDQIFGGSVGVNSAGQLVYGIDSYWKIRLK